MGLTITSISLHRKSDTEKKTLLCIIVLRVKIIGDECDHRNILMSD